MPYCGSQRYILEHFLRIQTTRQEEWLSAFQILSGNPILSQQLREDTGRSGLCARLSCLESDQLNVIGAYISHENTITGTIGDSVVMTMVLEGFLELTVSGKTSP